MSKNKLQALGINSKKDISSLRNGATLQICSLVLSDLFPSPFRPVLLSDLTFQPFLSSIQLAVQMICCRCYLTIDPISIAIKSNIYTPQESANVSNHHHFSHSRRSEAEKILYMRATVHSVCDCIPAFCHWLEKYVFLSFAMKMSFHRATEQ